MRIPFLLVCLFLFGAVHARGKDLYQIRVYRLANNAQLEAVRHYLSKAFVPAAHRAGLRSVGVFEPLGVDTASAKWVYVVLPFRSEKQWRHFDERLLRDEAYLQASSSFREAPSDKPPYERMESMLLEAFNGQKHFVLPQKKMGTVYELRSYESPTEHLHGKKVSMFENEEIALFKKLDFRTVFYARVLSGSRMPNFLYMPCFDSVADRNAHWKTFGDDPQWKEMSARPENENKVSVSHIDSILMTAAACSDW